MTARTSSISRSGFSTLLALGTAAMFAFPFLVMALTAFKPPSEIFRFPPVLLPAHWTTDNFAAAADDIPFWRYLRNTLVVTGGAVTGTVFSCPMVGYALAKMRWRGRGVVFATVLATMMVPPQVTLIPLYLFWDRLGQVGSYVPLVVPAFLGTPFFIFLMRQFLMKLPDDLI